MFTMIAFIAMTVFWTSGIMLGFWGTGLDFAHLGDSLVSRSRGPAMLLFFDDLHLPHRNTAIGSLIAALENLMLVALASLAVWQMVAWIRVRGHVRRFARDHDARDLPPDRAPRLRRFVATVSHKLGVPIPHLATKGGSLGGVVLGSSRRPVLFLDGPPTWQEVFWNRHREALILHEMGHVVNRDVDTREWSLALLHTTIPALLLLALLWLPLVYLSPHFGANLFRILIVAIALYVVLKLILWRLIRIREYYADWRVVTWNRADALIAFLSVSPPEASPAARQAGEGFRSWLGRLVLRHTPAILRSTRDFHPSHEARLTILHHPERLFRTDPTTVFTSGFLLGLLSFVLATFVLPTQFWLAAKGMEGYLALAEATRAWHPQLRGLTSVAGHIVLNLGLPTLYPLGVMWGLTHLVTRGFGIQVEKQAVADLVLHGPGSWGYTALWRPSLWFLSGLVATTPFFLPDIGRFDSGSLLLLHLLWLVGFWILIWVWATLLRFTVRTLLGTRAETKSPQWLRRAIRWASTLILTAFFWPAYGAFLGLRLSRTEWWYSSMTATMTHAPDPNLALNQVMIGMFAMAYLCAVLIFVLLTWGLILGAGLALYRKPHCPTCHAPCESLFVMGRDCAHCGASLTPWLFVEVRDIDRDWRVVTPPHQFPASHHRP
ncbi:Peptidase-M48 domain-containing protein [Sulfidibacter corallicola]|uniref:Peptidase M48 domain-containing protein n=1 Tax=Sulfidibacter corallicola TaxID=2818388 RepID=A0A8A4TQJ4_SULCO|nr:M48 family metalloprotease [Sulfidibacter corallicola]QTD51454.1 hypothetical protein J3U87_03205 [Sulfidibacter corallicola]